jgi:flavorubredoxin
MIPTLPREIAPGIHWLGVCAQPLVDNQQLHGHFSAFVILGQTEVLMVDTGTPTDWPEIEEQLDAILGRRRIDWLAPTHPEPPHCGNLGFLLDKYPEAKVVGDVRDYHLFFPEHADRLVRHAVGDVLDLGGGYSFVFVAPVQRDLPSTQWGYESSKQVLFVADAFPFPHEGPTLEDHGPLHHPGECALTTRELRERGIYIDVGAASKATVRTFFASQYTDADLVFGRLEKIFERYPPQFVAPAHGNVIDNWAEVMPLFRDIFKGAHA